MYIVIYIQEFVHSLIIKLLQSMTISTIILYTHNRL